MTAEELRRKFNDEFALGDWPDHYEVDAETYGNVCQTVFDNQVQFMNGHAHLEILIGSNNGIMFKNVELILEPMEIVKSIETTFLNTSELRTIYDLLRNHYISYENIEAIELLNKVSRILEENI